MVDRVYPLKLETLDDGSQTDIWPNELNPNEDAVSVRGVFVQNDTSDDTAAFMSRDALDNMTFVDGVTAEKTLAELAVDYGPVTGEPTGFRDRTDSTLAFDDGTRTLTVAPAVDSAVAAARAPPRRRARS